ncbi:MAG: glycosyltransferase family 4 protein [bacterium]|nr:glycosyltransferase family 4 protein [bacterium]
MHIRLGLDARKVTDFGIGTYVYNLLRGLASVDDVELTLLARPDNQERLAEIAPSASMISLAAREYSLREQAQLPVALSRERLDLLHVPHYVLSPVLWCPTVATVHDVIQLFYPPRERRMLALIYLRFMLRSTLRRARRIITVSRSSRRDLIELFGADRSRLTVVPNGVDHELAERPESETIEAVKEEYGLKPPLTLVVANDKPHKNLDVALRAFHLAMRRHALPGQLVYVGGMEGESRLAIRASRLGIEDRVRFLGKVPFAHLHGLYHVASVLLHTALYEGFGLPVLEAMCAGLPVVTSNLGAMREVGEGVARLVNPLDLDEIASALEQVLVDDPLRRRMTEAGRRRAEAMSWELTVEKTLEVYREVLREV